MLAAVYPDVLRDLERDQIQYMPWVHAEIAVYDRVRRGNGRVIGSTSNVNKVVMVAQR